MNKNLKNHYQNVIVYDLITKLHYQNVFEIIKISKIYLNIGFKNANIEKKKLINLIVLLKLITNQNSSLTRSKKDNIFFKIKKGSIVGCKVTLQKDNIYLFLEKFLIFILPNIKNLQINSKNILNFQILNILDFFELKTEFLKFNKISSIDVSIHTNSKKNIDVLLLYNFFYFFQNQKKLRK
jgi:large subunit ribosomal protein L5